MHALPKSFEGTDRYELRRLLGRGGMGVVYEAIDHRYATRVALKLLPIGRADLLLRFKREFRAASEIRHTNLVRLGDLVAYGDHWFFTMELIHGVDLVSYVRGREVRQPMPSGLIVKGQKVENESSDRTMPASVPPSSNSGIGIADEKLLRAAFVGLVRGVSALHRAGCVHRDVKPSNVMVDHTGRVVVLDFGLASFAPDETTLFGAGTPAYMAPEQTRPAPVQPSADWYAVGVMLFELLTGRLPFSGSPHEIVARKQSERAPSVHSLAPEAPGDLASLCDELLKPDPSSRPDEARILSVMDPDAPLTPRSELPSHRSVILGREQEQKQLEASLSELIETGGARAVIVLGESGIGKSTLVRAFVENAAATGRTLTFSAKCYERELVPYKAVDGIVDAVLNWLARLDGAALTALLPKRADVLARAFPVLNRLDAFRAPAALDTSLDHRENRAQLFSAFRELLHAFSVNRPVILFIDDLHWGDRDSISLLAEALRPPNAPRLLLIGTARSAASETAHERLFPSDIQESTLTIPKLSSESADALVHVLTVGRTVDTATLERLARESGGHPLFLRELVQSTLVNGTVPATVTLESVLRGRIAKLIDVAQKLLKILVVAGAPITVAVAGEAADVKGSELEQAVEGLRAARLIVTAYRDESESLDLAHDRVRTTVLAELGDVEIRAAHARIATALEDAGDRIASATHWRAALETERAAEHYRAAAELSARSLAFDDAAEQYQIALELGNWSPEQRQAVELSLADTLANAGKGALSATRYLSAAVNATFEQRLRLHRRATEELIWSGRLSEGLEIGRAVLKDAGMRLARFPLFALLFRRVLLRLRGLGYRERARNEVDGRELERIDLCWSFSSGLVLTDHIQGAYFQAVGLWRALQHGDLPRLARGLAAEAAFIAGYARYDHERTALLLDRADRLATRVDDSRAGATVLMMSGIADHLRGDFKRARSRLESAMGLLRERCMGATWELDASRQFWLECLFYEGELGVFAEAVEEGIRQAHIRGSVYSATNLRTGLPNALWLLQNRPAEAREHASEAISRWSTRGFHVQHWYDLVAQTHIDLYECKGGSAHARFERAWRDLERSHLLRVNHTRVVATQLRARAAVAAATELSGPGRTRCLNLARSSENSLRGESAPWGRALGQLICAERESLERPEQAENAIELARDQLKATNLGLYQAALQSVSSRSLPAPLTDRGVVNPSAFARMLLPGLCSNLRLDGRSEHTE